MSLQRNLLGIWQSFFYLTFITFIVIFVSTIGLGASGAEANRIPAGASNPLPEVIPPGVTPWLTIDLADVVEAQWVHTPRPGFSSAGLSQVVPDPQGRVLPFGDLQNSLTALLLRSLPEGHNALDAIKLDPLSGMVERKNIEGADGSFSVSKAVRTGNDTFSWTAAQENAGETQGTKFQYNYSTGELTQDVQLPADIYSADYDFVTTRSGGWLSSQAYFNAATYQISVILENDRGQEGTLTFTGSNLAAVLGTGNPTVSFLPNDLGGIGLAGTLTKRTGQFEATPFGWHLNDAQQALDEAVDGVIPPDKIEMAPYPSEPHFTFNQSTGFDTEAVPCGCGNNFCLCEPALNFGRDKLLLRQFNPQTNTSTEMEIGCLSGLESGVAKVGASSFYYVDPFEPTDFLEVTVFGQTVFVSVEDAFKSTGIFVRSLYNSLLDVPKAEAILEAFARAKGGFVLLGVAFSGLYDSSSSQGNQTDSVLAVSPRGTTGNSVVIYTVNPNVQTSLAQVVLPETEVTVANHGETADPVTVRLFSQAGELIDTQEFIVPPKGSTSFQPGTPGDPLQASWGQVSSLTGASTALGTFQFNVGATTLPEVGVPQAPLSRRWGFSGEVRPDKNTGLAVSNPFNQAAECTVHLYDSPGEMLAEAPLEVPALGQVALFLTDLDLTFPAGSGLENFKGAFQLECSQLVGAMVLTQDNRGFLVNIPGTPLP